MRFCFPTCCLARVALTGLLLATGLPLRAQPPGRRPAPADTARLQHLADSLTRTNTQAYQRAGERLRQAGLPQVERFPGGRLEILGFDAFGRPRALSTANVDAAATVGTNHVQPGGRLGTALTGKGELIGEWDGGAVLGSHVELFGRVTQQDSAPDTSNHATHVAGTMLASGIDPAAKGMATEARLLAHDWVNDNGEMAAAAANGLLVSNHSYGFITGWRYDRGDDRWQWWGTPAVDLREDYRFGFYSGRSRGWDQIAHNAPNYLIVKSAGNDRNDDLPASVDTHYVWSDTLSQWVPSTAQRSPDGPFDSITEVGIAKNILTVGAVNDIPNGYSQPSDVQVTSFTGFGPADDGRIKPDLVANGLGLYSPVANSVLAYDNFSGTSMSAPNTTGSLALLQQLHKQATGGPMSAALLKALVLHTADEAGTTPGPDYRHGWGLLNTERAARVILGRQDTHRLLTGSLQSGDTLRYRFTASGCQPLRATLVWTDPAGTPTQAKLDPDSAMLVNDIDLRIRQRDGSLSRPWVLDKNNPTAAATRADNTRDNVEQVLIPNPQGGLVTIRLSHKNSLQGGRQAFALILTGVGDNSLATSLPADTAVCFGDTATLTATPAGGVAPYSFQWAGGSPQSPSRTAPAEGEYIFELRDAKGCARFDTVRLRWTPDFELGADTLLCEGESFQLGTGLGGSVSHLWHTGAASPSITVQDTGLVWVEATTPGGCTRRDSLHVAIAGELPSDSLLADGPLSFCPGGDVLLTAYEPGWDYDWSTGDTTRGIFVSQSGTYSVNISSSCASVTGGPVQVNVLPKPPPPAIQVQGDSLRSSVAHSYQWLRDGQPIPGATARSYLPQSAGLFQVRVTNAAGCSASSVPQTIAPTGRTGAGPLSALRVFPNPTAGRLMIEWPAELRNGTASLSLHDATGRRVWEWAGTAAERQNFSLPARLPAGAYVLQIRMAAARATQRVMLTR